MLHPDGSFPVKGEKLNCTKRAEDLSFELYQEGIGFAINLLLEYCLQSHLKLEQKHAKIND
jgi:hypothetical protein